MNRKLYLTLATLGVIALLCISLRESDSTSLRRESDSTSLRREKDHQWSLWGGSSTPVVGWNYDAADNQICSDECTNKGGIVCNEPAKKQCCAAAKCGTKKFFSRQLPFCYHILDTSYISKDSSKKVVCSVNFPNRT